MAESGVNQRQAIDFIDEKKIFVTIWVKRLNAKLLFWCDFNKCHVLPVGIVSLQPAACKILDLIKLVEQMMGQPTVAHHAVIELNVGALLRLSKLDEVNADAPA